MANIEILKDYASTSIEGTITNRLTILLINPIDGS